MLAAYALGALEREEARSLEEHLATCRECGPEMADWLNAASALSLTAPTVEPPAALRTRILESVRTVAQKESTKVIPLPPVEHRRWGKGVWTGAIAAALAILALTASLLVLWYRYQELRRQYEREHTAVEVLARQAAQEREARELLTAPGARTAQLAGTAVAKDASAMLAFDPKTGRAMLFAYNLPPAPPGKAYQLWYIEDLQHPVPGGVFNTDARGGAVMHHSVPEAGRKASVFAVTLEPQSGVSAPTGDKYLLSPVS